MYEKPITRYVDTDTAPFLELSKGGLISAFLYSANVLSGGKITKLDPENAKVRSIAVSGIFHLPECFFADRLGFAIESGEDTVSLTKDGVRADFRLNSRDFSLFGEKASLSSPVTHENGHFYFDAMGVCRAFGITAQIFCLGKLFVIADPEALERLEGNESLANSGCFATLGPYRSREMTHEDFVKAKDKWRKVLVGSPEMNCTGEKNMEEKLRSIADECEELLKTMHRNADAVILWGDEPPTESSHLTAQYSRIWRLAMAYGTAGNRYYKNKEVLDAVKFGLRWMYDNMYGEAEIEGRGWRDTHLFNWWDWHVGAIEPFTDTLLVVEDELTPEEIKTYLRCYDYVCTFMRQGYDRPNASSRIKTGSKEALLTENGEMLYQRFLDYDLQFEEVEGTRGKYTDYCRWEHHFPYNLMYGLGNLHRTVFLASCLAGTPAEFPSPFLYDMFTLVRYMFETSIYKGQGFSIFRGRGNAGVELRFGAETMAKTLFLVGLFGQDEDRYIKTMIKRNARDPEFVKDMISCCPVYYLALLTDLLNDPTIPSDGNYEVTHAWFTAERIAHHKRDHAFLLAMPSSRHPNYESINSANKMGWYTGDGGLYLYTDTDNHSFDGVNFISNPRVAHRIPGTTADDRERKPWSFKRGWRSSKDFAGCLDLEKRYGIGAFDYEPYHHEGHEADGTVDDGYGGGFVYHENDLVAKKSYFFFDEEAVCLGAGISSTMNATVNTTVEHRRLVKDGETGTEKVTSDGKAILTDIGDVTLNSPSYVHLEGFAGFIFPESCTVCGSKYRYNVEDGKFDHYFTDGGGVFGKREKTFFELGITHGKNPKDATYSYVILPAKSEEETAAYAKAPKVRIRRNDSLVQSCEKPESGVVGTVFYEAGEFGGISASVPSIIMTKATETAFTFSVCDPTQLQESGKFVIDRKLKCTNHSRELTVDTETLEGKTVIVADFSNLAGKDLVAEFTV